MKYPIIVGFEALLTLALLSLKFIDGPVAIFIRSSRELSSILVLVIFMVMVDLIRRMINFVQAKGKTRPMERKNNFHYGINNLAKLLISLAAIITIFALFKIDLKTLLTSLSIIAAAIAIITKEFINDFLVGLYFSFSNDIEINDYVRFGEHKGKVAEIQMLKIKILNDDDDLVIIPNSKIYNHEIVNYTKRDIRLLSVDFQIAISAVHSIELLEAELINSIENFSDFLEMDSFNLKIVDMKMDRIDCKFQYVIKELDRVLQNKIKKKTVRYIFNYISVKSGVSNPEENWT